MTVMNSLSHFHFGIAGAGLVGRVLALELLHQFPHAQVTLFDRDPAARSLAEQSAAGVAAAGMLAPYAELEHSPPEVFELGQISMELWPQILQRLGIAKAFQQRGSLILAHPNDQRDLQHFIAQLRRKAPLDNVVEQLCGETLNALETDLSQTNLTNANASYWLKTEGAINGQWFMQRSQSHLLEHPRVTWKFAHSVSNLRERNIEANSETHTFNWVFDTRGLGAKADLSNLRAVRGEVFWLDAPEVNLTRPVRLMHPRYKLYIVPRTNNPETPHRYVIGATEIESDDDSPMSVRSALELLSALYSVHSGFAEARIVQQLSNRRPAFPDNLPQVSTTQGKTSINGLYRHGYLLSPVLVAQAISEMRTLL